MQAEHNNNWKVYYKSDSWRVRWVPTTRHCSTDAKYLFYLQWAKHKYFKGVDKNTFFPLYGEEEQQKKRNGTYREKWWENYNYLLGSGIGIHMAFPKLA